MPKKTFIPGEVLTAANVNTFLMDQSVMTFADSAARGSAIGTATEGMVSYLNNTNSLELYNGSSWSQLNPSQGNAIINGAFDIWQRGTGPFTVNTSFTADRWQFFEQATGVGEVTRETFTPAEINAIGFGDAEFYLKMGMTTSVAFNGMRTKIEGVRTLAGQTATISFWAKGVNPSDGSWLLAPNQNFGSGGSAAVAVTAQSFTVTTSWQRFTLTFALPSISGKTIGASNFLQLEFRASGSATSAASELNLWGVQLEAGSVATPFKRNANSIQGELAACQRYYQNMSGSNQTVGTGYATSTTNVRFQIPSTEIMRTIPSASATDGFLVNVSGTLFTTTATTPNDSNSFGVFGNATSSGLTVNNFYLVRFDTLELSAEL